MIKSIAEIGINHGGDKKKLFRLIDLAKKSGCWGVKFQYRSENFFAKNDEMGSTLIRKELKKSNINDNWIIEIINYCKSIDINLGFSFFRNIDMELFFSKFDYIDFIKIPSPEFRNIDLINLAKSFSKQIMISYGGGREDEIFNFISKSKLRKNDVIFHCISNYPTSIGNQQLDFIDRLKNKFEFKIGYSSHDEDWEINLLAATKGIDFIERHLCEDKSDLGLDISTSSDFNDFKKLNKILSSIYDIYNCKFRVPNQGEILNIRNLGSSLYAIKDIDINSKVSIKDFEEKSPSVGITIEYFQQSNEKVLKKKILKGEPLLASHFKESYSISKKIIDFSDKNKISIPVRLHDFEKIKNKFKIKRYEFHLSFAEVMSLNQHYNKLLGIIRDDYEISIHLPDYIDENNLIDPFNSSEYVKNKSLEIIHICTDFASKIQKKTNKNCYVLGSLSMNPFESKDVFYKNALNLVNSIKEEYGVDLLYQWLPKKAWYFGGTVLVDLFCSEEDISYCKKYEIPLCLDIAHLILSANYFEKKWYDWFIQLKELCFHIHLSDAVGTDGEGVDFGNGDIHSIESLLEFKSIKVLEIWEGHIDDGKKFEEGLNYLHKL